MIPDLKSGDPVTIFRVSGSGPIDAWVEVRPVGLSALIHFVTIAVATDGSGVIGQLLEDEEDLFWARGHGDDVAAALLLTRSAR